jgi:hypothetical protein
LKKSLIIPAFGVLLVIAFCGDFSNSNPKPLAFTTQSLKALEQIESEAGWFTVVVTKDQDHKVLDWFENNPQLKQLKESTEFRHYTSGSAVFRSQLSKAYGNDYPIICIQDQTGAMRASVGGSQLKSILSASQLALELDHMAHSLRPIKEALIEGRWCPDGICLTPMTKPFDGVIDRADEALQSRSDAIMNDLETRIDAMLKKYAPWLFAAIA